MAFISEYDNPVKRISGLIVLSGISFAAFKGYRYLGTIITVALFLLCFHFITLHQSNRTTFDPNAEIYVVKSFYAELNLRLAGQTIDIHYHPIYLIFLIITGIVYRNHLKEAIKKLIEVIK